MNLYAALQAMSSENYLVCENVHSLPKYLHFSYLLIKVTEILMMCLLRASRELSYTTGVRWPVHLCHFQPVCEVHHPTTFKLQRKD